MLGFPKTEDVDFARRHYPTGTRVVLLRKMNDPYSKLEPGDKGTVQFVDDAGIIHMNWDCGSSLGLIYGEDEFQIIKGRRN